jgi:hypothetical protein
MQRVEDLVDDPDATIREVMSWRVFMHSVAADIRRTSISAMRLLLGSVLVLSLLGCASFPPTAPNVKGKARVTEGLLVEAPREVRKDHLGKDVAQSGWKACTQDTLEPGQASSLVQERLVEALAQSAIFNSVSSQGANSKWTLSSDIRAFCSQTPGFVVRRIAGIVAIDFSLKRDGVVVWTQSFERVVTDADPDYTGSSFAWSVSDAMRQAMSDSLRLVLRDAVGAIDRAIAPH